MCLSIYLSIYPSIYLSIHLSIYTYLTIYMSTFWVILQVRLTSRGSLWRRGPASPTRGWVDAQTSMIHGLGRCNIWHRSSSKLGGPKHKGSMSPCGTYPGREGLQICRKDLSFQKKGALVRTPNGRALRRKTPHRDLQSIETATWTMGSLSPLTLAASCRRQGFKYQNHRQGPALSLEDQVKHTKLGPYTISLCKVFGP